MYVNATLLNYYLVCRRKLWLHAHAIRMEHTSDTVYEGKLIGETSYPQRAERYTEIELSHQAEPGGPLGGVTLTAKIDFYDPQQGVVHEVKKSTAKESAHIAQVRFYLYVLRRKGINADHGIIEYPKLRQAERVDLESGEEMLLEEQIRSVAQIVSGTVCPPLLPKSKCKSCSYYDFCWSAESDESI